MYPATQYKQRQAHDYCYTVKTDYINITFRLQQSTFLQETEKT